MSLRSHLIALAATMLSLVSPSLAETIDINLIDFQASGVLSYKYMGGPVTHGSSGVFVLGTSNPNGPEAELLGDPIYGFCIELLQPFSGDVHTYDLGPITNATVPPSPGFGTISPESAFMIRQLWATSFDPSWTAPGPYSIAQITTAMAFHALLYEIAIDFDGVNLSSIDLTTGDFIVTAAHLLNVNNPLEELPINLVAHALACDLDLNYTGPLADLCSLTNPQFQDYLVECVPVPEASSMVLAGIGSVVAFAVGLKRRRAAKIEA